MEADGHDRERLEPVPPVVCPRHDRWLYRLLSLPDGVVVLERDERTGVSRLWTCADLEERETSLRPVLDHLQRCRDAALEAHGEGVRQGASETAPQPVVAVAGTFARGSGV